MLHGHMNGIGSPSATMQRGSGAASTAAPPPSSAPHAVKSAAASSAAKRKDSLDRIAMGSISSRHLYRVIFARCDLSVTARGPVPSAAMELTIVVGNKNYSSW